MYSMRMIVLKMQYLWGYPIDERINYDTNPSIRGTFVNKILIQAKTTGFVYDEEHNSVGFRADFIYYIFIKLLQYPL